MKIFRIKGCYQYPHRPAEEVDDYYLADSAEQALTEYVALRKDRCKKDFRHRFVIRDVTGESQ